MLLKQDHNGDLRETAYARYAIQSGLKLITWTMESRLSDIAGFHPRILIACWYLMRFTDEHRCPCFFGLARHGYPLRKLHGFVS